MEKYKHWDVYEKIPEGWKIDKTAGSPLHGYEFINNGKSIINGGKRSLVRVCMDALRIVTTETVIQKTEEIQTKPKQIIDKNYVKTVNELARKKFQERLLKDISADLMVCELEDWNKLEYINELKKLIDSLLNHNKEA